MMKTLATTTALAASLGVVSANTAEASPSVNATPARAALRSHASAPPQSAIDQAIANYVATQNSKSPASNKSNLSAGWKLNGWDITVTSVQPGKVIPTILASCGVGGSGGTCNISRSVGIKGTVSAGGGLDFKTFKANIDYSVEASITTTINSTSPRMNSRQMWVARPQGTFFIFKWTNYDWGSSSSGSGTAFSPTGVQFRVVPV